MTTPQHPDQARRSFTAAVVVAATVLAVVIGVNQLVPGATAQEPRPPVAVPSGEQPELAGLDPELAARFLRAQKAAAAAGYPLRVTSGARTVEEQQRLLDEAVAEHGSPEAARQWVLPPEESAHVRGEAVDVGPAESRGWLAQHGAEFGLCLVYANEPWHVEATVEPGGTCPSLVPDASTAP